MSISTSRMVTILGVTSAGQDCVLHRGPGNESLNNLFQAQRGNVAIKYRGDHAESIEGEQAFQQIQIDIYEADGLTSAVAKRPLDFLRHAGLYAADATLDPGGIVWAFQLRITITHPVVGTSRIVLSQVYVTDPQWSSSTEGNKITATLENRGTVTIT